ncbi:uncharacterized protein DDB_G0290685 isoform X2 [Orussus abietinus]|uniref:uncharacterized protein DDB_G0290685 isoform X2 n=1 Tax=Orussus abietinus TaxID=222816 RepID=UPI000C716201|nr:uncharacterized protein DDB_G0290685 isoform X2 [Orussus abietinus]
MEQFEQLLTCAICLDRYRNPKLLPCQHSFCMEPCMDGLVDYVRRQVKCPECRAEHRIPYQGVQAFPTNVTLQRFLELHIEITGELPDPTSGQTMERCGVCSEKSYCSLCVHCEKKCCPECKDAHMDILRREIARINSQVRRGLHRLQDALALVEKNTLGLQTNCASVAEEVDEIYRRLSKALKDRTEHLRNEVDRYLGAELRGLIQLKENLELEIANIQSNCDLAEAHINENVPWDDAELLDTKELFLRTVEFIRNFEYEAGDYNRRVRFVMAHDPNQLVLHVAGYGELNIKPETGSGALLGSTGGLAPPGGSPGLMRSKSDHRLASQYRQDEDRLSRNRYVPDYDYDAPEYEPPRNKSRYRSRFMRHRDGDDSDGDSRSTVRFTSTPQEQSQGLRERVLDTEDAARGPLSGIFRLTDSPRVMKKLQECERAVKRKKDEPQQPQPPAPKPQVQVRKTPTAVARQVSEDDEISRIKKQNKNAPPPAETLEEHPATTPTPTHPTPRETQEREPEEPPRRTPIARRTSTEGHAPGARSASSDSSTGSESSTGSGIRNTGASFTAEEMKQKYLSRAPTNVSTTTTVTSAPGVTSTPSRDSTGPATSPRPFQSRFLGAGNRAAPPPPAPVAREEPKKKEEEEEEEETSSSSSEETESETEEESEAEAQPANPTPSNPPASQDRHRSESAMARTDIGPLLARSAEARRGSKEDSPSARYSTPRGSPAQSASSPTSTTPPVTTTTKTHPTPTATTPLTTTTTSSSSPSGTSSPGGYTSRAVNDESDLASSGDDSVEDSATKVSGVENEPIFRVSGIEGSHPGSDRGLETDVEGKSEANDIGARNREDEEEDEDDEDESPGKDRDLETEGNATMATDGGVRREVEDDDEEDEDTPSGELRVELNVGKNLGNGDESSESYDEEKRPDEILKREKLERQGSKKKEDLDSLFDDNGWVVTEMEVQSEKRSSRNRRIGKGGPEVNKADEVEKREIRKLKNGGLKSDDSKLVEPSKLARNGSKMVNGGPARKPSGITSLDGVQRALKKTGSGSSLENVENVENGGSESSNTTDESQEDDSSEPESSEVAALRITEEESKQRLRLENSNNFRNQNHGGSKIQPNAELLDQVPNTPKDPNPRNRVYRQSNIGENGWLVSDGSESEYERAEKRSEALNRNSGDAARIEVQPSNKASRKGSKTPQDSLKSIDDSGWVIVQTSENDEEDVEEGDKNVEGGDKERNNEDQFREVPRYKRSRPLGWTDRRDVDDTRFSKRPENGTVVASARNCQKTGKSGQLEERSDSDMSIPMQMVTTVFCVSILCYSVLINLFL